MTGHAFIRPGQVAPELPPPDQCVRCGEPEAAHAAAQHDVRFNGAVDGSGIVAYCDPCQWSVWLDDGHTLADLTRLAHMHAGTVLPTGVSRDGSATLSPADLLTVLAALWVARHNASPADEGRYRRLAAALGESR